MHEQDLPFQPYSAQTFPPLEEHDFENAPPHSMESESAVIGSLLMDNSAWDAVAEILKESHFYRREHQIIWRAISSMQLAGKPADVITTNEKLREMGKAEEIGGIFYLNQLAQYVASVANIVRYAETIREMAIKRNLLEAANGIARAVHKPNGKSLDLILDEAEARILSVGEQTSKGKLGFQSTASLSVSFLDELQELAENPSAVTGVSTGLDDLDKATTGLQSGDLIVLAARPSMGKTSLAVNIGEHVAIEQNLPVAIFSMEMGAKQLMLRMVGSVGRIDQSKLRTGMLENDEWSRVGEAVERIGNAPIHIDDTPGLKPNELRANARRLARQFGGKLGLIVVDYLQLMSSNGDGSSDNRATELGDMTRSLKALGKELSCPVIALSQLNRSVEQRTDKRPIMSDLRESGAIEQDADIIMFIYRDDYYNKDSKEPNVAEVIIAKQRNGPTGTVKTYFQKNLTRFENLAMGSGAY